MHTHILNVAKIQHLWLHVLHNHYNIYHIAKSTYCVAVHKFEANVQVQYEIRDTIWDHIMTRALRDGISYSEDWQYIPLGGLADMKMWIMLGRFSFRARSQFPEQVPS